MFGIIDLGLVPRAFYILKGSEIKFRKAQYLADVIVNFLADDAECLFLDLDLGLKELFIKVSLHFFFFF
jgi:hypothetical protein